MDRDKEQVEAKAVVVAKAALAVALEVVLQQDRVDIVSAPTAVKKQTINWELPVTSKNAPSAERP
ncbi:MAG: hypothetical protein U9N82_00720 [Thermodesulfobacteriota bacterium]|nr:hypothetical protein [Thermodesulfobacteriota bacterium]